MTEREVQARAFRWLSKAIGRRQFHLRFNSDLFRFHFSILIFATAILPDQQQAKNILLLHTHAPRVAGVSLRQNATAAPPLCQRLPFVSSPVASWAAGGEARGRDGIQFQTNFFNSIEVRP
jgi:hypothetical protein